MLALVWWAVAFSLVLKRRLHVAVVVRRLNFRCDSKIVLSQIEVSKVECVFIQSWGQIDHVFLCLLDLGKCRTFLRQSVLPSLRCFLWCIRLGDLLWESSCTHHWIILPPFSIICSCSLHCLASIQRDTRVRVELNALQFDVPRSRNGWILTSFRLVSFYFYNDLFACLSVLVLDEYFFGIKVLIWIAMSESLTYCRLFECFNRTFSVFVLSLCETFLSYWLLLNLEFRLLNLLFFLFLHSLIEYCRLQMYTCHTTYIHLWVLVCWRIHHLWKHIRGCNRWVIAFLVLNLHIGRWLNPVSSTRLFWFRLLLQFHLSDHDGPLVWLWLLLNLLFWLQRT